MPLQAYPQIFEDSLLTKPYKTFIPIGDLDSIDSVFQVLQDRNLDQLDHLPKGDNCI